MKLLIDKGADANVKDKNDQTALMSAAGGRQLELAKFLIKNGAEVDA